MSGNNLSDMLKASLLMNQKEGNPIYTFLMLTVFEFLIKYVTQGIEFIKNILEAKFKRKFSDTLSKNMPSVLNTDPNEIEFERKFTNKTKSEDYIKVDSILHHITSLPHIKKIIYSRSAYLINYKENVAIDDKIFFQLSKIENDAEGEIASIGFKIFTTKENTPYLKQFVDNCEKDYIIRKKNKLGESLYFFDHHIITKNDFNNSPDKERPIFTKNLFVTNRTFKNIFFESKQNVENRVNFFMNRKQWYDAKGIPHCLGLLLHGVPGCGKTSTIKAIANITNRHIININLSKIKSKTQLKSLFYDERIAVLEKNDVGGNMEHYIIPIDKRIFIIEDLDCLDGDLLFRRDKKKEKEDKKKAKEEKKKLEAKKFGYVTQQKPVMATMSTDPTGASILPGRGDPGNMYASMLSDIGNSSRLLPATQNPRATEEEEDPEDKIDLSSILNILDGTLETPGRILIITSNYPEKLDQALVRPGRIDMIIEFKKCNRAIITEMYESFYESAPNKDDINRIVEYKWTPAEVGQILFKNFYEPEQAIIDLITYQPETYFKFSYFNNNSDTTTNTDNSSEHGDEPSNNNEPKAEDKIPTIMNIPAQFSPVIETPHLPTLQRPISDQNVFDYQQINNIYQNPTFTIPDTIDNNDWMNKGWKKVGEQYAQNQQNNNQIDLHISDSDQQSAFKLKSMMEINDKDWTDTAEDSEFSKADKMQQLYTTSDPTEIMMRKQNGAYTNTRQEFINNIAPSTEMFINAKDKPLINGMHDGTSDINKSVITYMASEYAKYHQHDTARISKTLNEHITEYTPPDEVQKILDKYLYLK
jgi:hypothetical protein